jgi:MGT family glycosyltransferase
MHPHLAVVHELVRRGHRVSYLVGHHLAHLAADTGANVVGCTSVLPGAPGVTGWPEDDVVGMRMFLDEAVQVLPQVHAALDHERPDVVLYDIGGMAGPVAAERWGVPAAQLSPSIVAWDGYHDDMAAALAPMLSSPGYLAYREAFDDWLADSELSFDDVTGVRARCLVLIPRVMQLNSDLVGDRYRFVGPCLDPARADPGDWREPAGDGPLALVAFGTSYTRRPDVFRNVIAALDGMGWRMVLATGGRVPIEDLGAVPDWVQVEDVVPQVAVLHRADAFVTHAGMGSCTEALWCGAECPPLPFHRPSTNSATPNNWWPSASACTRHRTRPPRTNCGPRFSTLRAIPTSAADSMPSAPNCIATVGRITLPTRSRAWLRGHGESSVREVPELKPLDRREQRQREAVPHDHHCSTDRADPQACSVNRVEPGAKRPRHVGHQPPLQRRDTGDLADP